MSNYPFMAKAELVEGMLDQGQRVSKQPERCCAGGCEVPSLPKLPEGAPVELVDTAG